jgi:hypothetical protein
LSRKIANHNITIVTYVLNHNTDKKEKEWQRNKGGKPFQGRFVSVTRKERKVLEFQTTDGGKNACFPWKCANWKNILVDIRMFSVI